MFTSRNIIGLITLTLIATGVVFEFFAPPGSTARVALEEKIATPVVALAHLVPAIPLAPATRSTQLAAAATETSINNFSHAIYLAICPLVGGCPTDQPPPTVASRTLADVRTQAAAAAFATTPSTDFATTTATSTIPITPTATSQPSIIQNITNPIRERIIVQKATSQPTASQNWFSDRLSNLETTLNARIAAVAASIPAATSFSGGGAGAPTFANTFGLSQRIDNLSNTTITNPMITGGSISAASIAGTIGNAITSAIATIDDLTATHLVAVNATFTNSTTTNKVHVDDRPANRFDIEHACISS